MIQRDVTSLTLLERIRDPANEDERNQAWQEFLKRYGLWMQNWLIRQGCRPANAEDVCQETLIVVLSAIGNFEHNGHVGAFRRWLRLVIGHRLSAHRRNEAKEPESGGDRLDEVARELRNPQSELSREFVSGFRLELLRERFESLKDHFEASTFQAARLVLFEGKTARQAAQELGIKAGTVRVAKCRVLKRLREELNASLFE